MQKISTHLWFDSQAEEAANFYVSVFKNSKIGRIARYTAAAAKMTGRPKGSVLTVVFQLDGQEFIALNGGPLFKFSEAISLVVNCTSQQELDEMWEKLTQGGGQPGQCGWLKDKYGLSWQIVPVEIAELMSDKNSAKVERVMQSILTMTKIDIAQLKQASNQG